MIRKLVTVVALVIGVSVTAAHADWINKDLKYVSSSGLCATDFQVVVEGTHWPAAWHYDGWPNGHFNGFTAGPAGAAPPRTIYTWDQFVDGGDNQICNGETIHIGWETSGQTSPTDCWFTRNGVRIEGSKVVQVGAHGGTTPGVDGWTGVVWHNAFEPLGIPQDTIWLANVRFAVFPAPIDPDSLNSHNVALENALQSMFPTPPIPLNPQVVLPFCEPVTVLFPFPVLGDEWLVMSYNVIGEGSSAEVRDFVMFAPRNGPIPTLSEWGAIIFGTLLLGSVMFYIWRRRRLAVA